MRYFLVTVLRYRVWNSAILCLGFILPACPCQALPENYGGLRKQTWILVHLLFHWLSSGHEPKHDIDHNYKMSSNLYCPRQASLELWESKIAANWEIDLNCSMCIPIYKSELKVGKPNHCDCTRVCTFINIFTCRKLSFYKYKKIMNQAGFYKLDL